MLHRDVLHADIDAVCDAQRGGALEASVAAAAAARARAPPVVVRDRQIRQHDVARQPVSGRALVRGMRSRNPPRRRMHRLCRVAARIHSGRPEPALTSDQAWQRPSLVILERLPQCLRGAAVRLRSIAKDKDLLRPSRHELQGPDVLAWLLPAHTHTAVCH